MTRAGEARRSVALRASPSDRKSAKLPLRRRAAPDQAMGVTISKPDNEL
jgi:hypothetical protein